MSENYLKLRDVVEFNLINDSLISIKHDFDHKVGAFGIQDELLAQSNNVTKGLKVRIAATHAGLITSNNMFYLPDKMKQSVSSFFEGYQKPVLRHHNQKDDAIGRIVDAVYVDTSKKILDSYRGLSVLDSLQNKLVLDEVLLDNFCLGNMPFGMQVDVVRNLFNKRIKDGRSVLEDPSYEGLGHIQIVCNITDSEAIEKFLDGRYLTGSIGARTDRAVCSICKQDWIKDDACEHIPGATYDDQKCILIAGKFIYDEYSVVNAPADRHSVVLELYYNGRLKDISIKNEHVGSVPEAKIGFPQYDKEPREAFLMKDKNQQIQDSASDAPPVENKDLAVKDAAAVKQPELDSSPQDKSVQDAETSEAFIQRVLDAEKLSDEEVDKLYDIMFDDEVFKDAKLSTAQRKKLAASTFCGPDRSFPVPDCSHYTAALRLLGRYKGSGDKSKIKACIERKGKALGCTKKAKTEDDMNHARAFHMLISVIEEHLYGAKYSEEGKEPLLSEEDMKALGGVMKRLVVLVGQDNFVKALSGQDVELKDVVKHFQDVDLLDEIVKLETELGKIREDLDDANSTSLALKEEFDLLQKDVSVFRDEVVAEKVKVKTLTIEQLKLLNVLKGITLDEAKETELAALSDEVLGNEINKIKEEIDIKKITGKLGDGIYNKPEGMIEDPTLKLEGNGKQSIGKEEFQRRISEIEERYMMMKFRNSHMAEQWRAKVIEELKKEVDLPSEE